MRGVRMLQLRGACRVCARVWKGGVSACAPDEVGQQHRSEEMLSPVVELGRAAELGVRQELREGGGCRGSADVRSSFLLLLLLLQCCVALLCSRLLQQREAGETQRGLVLRIK